MPIYEYRCTNGHTFECLQRMSDDPVAICTTCGAASARVLHPPAVHFKGSGFYTTDYGKRGRNAAGDSSTDGARKDGDAGAAKKADPSSTDKAGASTAGSSSSKAGSGSSDS